MTFLSQLLDTEDNFIYAGYVVVSLPGLKAAILHLFHSGARPSEPPHR